MDRIPPLGFLRKFSCPREGFEVPRYFFHAKCGQVIVLDQEGIDSQTLLGLRKRQDSARNGVWRMMLGTEGLSVVE
jgi:hypothetical protein